MEKPDSEQNQTEKERINKITHPKQEGTLNILAIEKNILYNFIIKKLIFEKNEKDKEQNNIMNLNTDDNKEIMDQLMFHCEKLTFLSSEKDDDKNISKLLEEISKNLKKLNIS